MKLIYVERSNLFRTFCNSFRYYLSRVKKLRFIFQSECGRKIECIAISIDHSDRMSTVHNNWVRKWENCVQVSRPYLSFKRLIKTSCRPWIGCRAAWFVFRLVYSHGSWVIRVLKWTWLGLGLGQVTGS